ncbi:hypothetical protein BGY98DRAFT_941721 [Russula aff. rugulosa BPL654]|nr:hypothetical protein BGY98DRAFT_941721 [Russula aff. rugulosa BPL654]
MTLEDLDQMPYLRAVKESRRVKPYLAIKPFPISDTYTVSPESPKGFRQTRFSAKLPRLWKRPSQFIVIEYAMMNIAIRTCLGQ